MVKLQINLTYCSFFYGKLRENYYLRRYNVFRAKYDIDSSLGFIGDDIRLYGNCNIF